MYSGAISYRALTVRTSINSAIIAIFPSALTKYYVLPRLSSPCNYST